MEKEAPWGQEPAERDDPMGMRRIVWDKRYDDRCRPGPRFYPSAGRGSALAGVMVQPIARSAAVLGVARETAHDRVLVAISDDGIYGHTWESWWKSA